VAAGARHSGGSSYELKAVTGGGVPASCHTQMRNLIASVAQTARSTRLAMSTRDVNSVDLIEVESMAMSPAVGQGAGRDYSLPAATRSDL
jgi:hypothetical protein